MEAVEIKQLCKESMVHSRLGKDEVAIQDGKDFYKQ